MSVSLPDMSLLERPEDPESTLLFLSTSIFFAWIWTSFIIYYGNSYFLIGSLFSFFNSLMSVPGSLLVLARCFKLFPLDGESYALAMVTNWLDISSILAFYVFDIFKSLTIIIGADLSIVNYGNAVKRLKYSYLS